MTTSTLRLCALHVLSAPASLKGDFRLVDAQPEVPSTSPSCSLLLKGLRYSPHQEFLRARVLDVKKQRHTTINIPKYHATSFLAWASGFSCLHPGVSQAALSSATGAPTAASGIDDAEWPSEWLAGRGMPEEVCLLAPGRVSSTSIHTSVRTEATGPPCWCTCKAFWAVDHPGVLVVGIKWETRAHCSAGIATNTLVPSGWQWELIQLSQNLEAVTVLQPRGMPPDRGPDSATPFSLEPLPPSKSLMQQGASVAAVQLSQHTESGHIAACIADNSQRACIVTLSMDLELVWHMVWPGQPSPQFAKQSKGASLASAIRQIQWLPGTSCLAVLDQYGQLHAVDSQRQPAHIELSSVVNPELVCGSSEGIAYSTSRKASRSNHQRLPTTNGTCFSMCCVKPTGRKDTLVSTQLTHSGDGARPNPEHLLLLSDGVTVIVMGYEPMAAPLPSTSPLLALQAGAVAGKPLPPATARRPSLPHLQTGHCHTLSADFHSRSLPATTRSAGYAPPTRAASLASSVLLLANPAMPAGSMLLAYASSSAPTTPQPAITWNITWQLLTEAPQPPNMITQGPTTPKAQGKEGGRRTTSIDSSHASPSHRSFRNLSLGGGSWTSPRASLTLSPQAPSPVAAGLHSPGSAPAPPPPFGLSGVSETQQDSPDLYWLDTATLDALQQGDVAVMDGRYEDALASYVQANVYGFLPSLLVLVHMGCMPCALQLLRAFSAIVNASATPSSSAGTSPSSSELQQAWGAAARSCLSPHLGAACPQYGRAASPSHETTAGGTGGQEPVASNSSPVGPVGEQGRVSGTQGVPLNKMPRISTGSAGGRGPLAEPAVLAALRQAARRQLGLACQCLAFLGTTLHSLAQAGRSLTASHPRHKRSPSRQVGNSLLLTTLDPSSPKTGRPRHRESSHHGRWSNPETVPHVIGLPIPIVWHALAPPANPGMAIPATTMEEDLSSCSTPSSCDVPSTPQPQRATMPSMRGGSQLHGCRLRLCHAAFDVMMLEHAAAAGLQRQPSCAHLGPGTPRPSYSQYGFGGDSWSGCASGGHCMCQWGQEVGVKVLDELRTPECAAGLLMLAHACDMEVQQFWLGQLQRQGHTASEAARALQLMLPAGRVSISGGSAGATSLSPARPATAASGGGASNAGGGGGSSGGAAGAPQVIAATRLNWQLLHHYPSAARSSALWKELGEWRKAAVLAFSVHHYLQMQPPAVRQLATGQQDQDERGDDSERGAHNEASPWPGTRLISATASGRTRRPVAPPPGSCLQIGWSILEEQMGPGLASLEVQEMCHTLHELVAIPRDVLGVASDVYVHLLQKASARLVDLVPKRVCITPLLPSPTAHSYPLLTFNAADIRAQLQAHLASSMATALSQMQLAMGCLPAGGCTRANLLVRGMLVAPEAEACLKMLLRWQGLYDAGQLQDAVEIVSDAVADQVMGGGGEWPGSTIVSLIDACPVKDELMPEADLEAVLSLLSSAIDALPGPSAAEDGTGVGAQPQQPAAAATVAPLFSLVDLNDASLIVDCSQLMGTFFKCMQPHAATMLDLLPGLVQQQGGGGGGAPGGIAGHMLTHSLHVVPEAVEVGATDTNHEVDRAADGRPSTGSTAPGNASKAHTSALHTSIAHHLGSLLELDWVLVCRAHMAALLQRVREVTGQGAARTAALDGASGGVPAASTTFARLGVTVSGGSVFSGRAGVVSPGSGVTAPQLCALEVLLLQWLCALVAADRIHADTELQASAVAVMSAVGGQGVPLSVVSDTDATLRGRNIFNSKLAEQVNRLKSAAGGGGAAPGAAGGGDEQVAGSHNPDAEQRPASSAAVVVLPGDFLVEPPDATRQRLISSTVAAFTAFAGVSTGAGDGAAAAPHRSLAALQRAEGGAQKQGQGPSPSAPRHTSLLQCTLAAVGAHPRLFTHSSQRGFRSVHSDLGVCFANPLLDPVLPTAPGIPPAPIAGSAGGNMTAGPVRGHDPLTQLHSMLAIHTWCVAPVTTPSIARHSITPPTSSRLHRPVTPSRLSTGCLSLSRPASATGPSGTLTAASAPGVPTSSATSAALKHLLSDSTRAAATSDDLTASNHQLHSRGSAEVVMPCAEGHETLIVTGNAEGDADVVDALRPVLTPRPPREVQGGERGEESRSPDPADTPTRSIMSLPARLTSLGTTPAASMDVVNGRWDPEIRLSPTAHARLAPRSAAHDSPEPGPTAEAGSPHRTTQAPSSAQKPAPSPPRTGEGHGKPPLYPVPLAQPPPAGAARRGIGSYPAHALLARNLSSPHEPNHSTSPMSDAVSRRALPCSDSQLAPAGNQGGGGRNDEQVFSRLSEGQQPDSRRHHSDGFKGAEAGTVEGDAVLMAEFLRPPLSPSNSFGVSLSLPPTSPHSHGHGQPTAHGGQGSPPRHAWAGSEHHPAPHHISADTCGAHAFLTVSQPSHTLTSSPRPHTPRTPGGGWWGEVGDGGTGMQPKLPRASAEGSFPMSAARLRVLSSINPLFNMGSSNGGGGGGVGLGEADMAQPSPRDRRGANKQAMGWKQASL